MSEMVERVALVFCRSGRFETGQGCCAAVCMDQLGEARKPKCRHAVKVHGKLARAAIRAMKGPLLTLEANAEDEAENNGYWSAIDDVRELFNAALETPDDP